MELKDISMAPKIQQFLPFYRIHQQTIKASSQVGSTLQTINS